VKSTRALLAAWCTVAVAMMAGACALGPYPPPAPPRHTELGIGITSLALPNGLRVVLVKDQHAAQVQVTMRYQVGAVDDLDRAGMAHLVEHLMFQQVLGGQTLFATLEDVTTYFNAVTTWDATTYISRGPLARLDTLLSVEAVRLGFRCTSINESTFDREREVVVNEIRGNTEVDTARMAVQRAAYPAGHPYGESIGGDASSVGTITFEEACKFVDAHYAPSNAVLVISGDITTEGAVKSLGKFIARVARRVASAPAHVAAPPSIGRVVDAKVPIESDSVLIAWPMPTNPRSRSRPTRSRVPSKRSSTCRSRARSPRSSSAMRARRCTARDRADRQGDGRRGGRAGEEGARAPALRVPADRLPPVR
jgi:predicted Zn-dependent peptidase